MRNLWIFNKTRLAIFSSLLSKECSSGCDLRKRLKMERNLLSYHLGVMKRHNFVREIRRGREKEYRLSPGRRDFVRRALEVVEEKQENL